MKNKRYVWWIVALVLAPVLVTLVIWSALFLLEYFNIDFDIPFTSANDWFMFFGSYFGAALTMVGVLLTIKHEKNIKKYEKAIHDIEKEEELLKQCILSISPMIPLMLYQRFIGLEISKDGYSANDVAAIRHDSASEYSKIGNARTCLECFTSMKHTTGCVDCNQKCKLGSIEKEFMVLYFKMTDCIFDSLDAINAYIEKQVQNVQYRIIVNLCNRINDNCVSIGKPPCYAEEDIQEYSSEIVDIEPMHKEIQEKIENSIDFHRSNISKLIQLSKDYIELKMEHADTQCYARKRGA